MINGQDNINRPVNLTPPEQLLSKINPPQAQEELVPPKDLATKSDLAQNDKLNVSNMITSAAAGGIGAAITAKNVGVIGESLRSVHVQNAMTELQNRSNSGYGNSYGGGYGGGYNDYGATEFVRRRGYGSVEYTSDGGYSVNNGGLSSPEARLAMSNLASGTLQGAKYGAIIGGAVSAVENAYNVITGKSKGKEALGAVAADTATATLSGAAGALTGGLTSIGLGLVGVGGIPGLVLAVGVGTAGAVGAQLITQKSGLYDSIKEKVMSFMK